MERPRLAASRGSAGRAHPRTATSGYDRLLTTRSEILHVPGIEWGGVLAPRGNIIRRTKDPDVEMIIMGRTRLTGDVFKQLNRLGTALHPGRLSEEEGAYMFRQEYARHLYFWLLEKGLHETPTAGDIQSQMHVVCGIR
jgi:hypothetical protein